MKTREIAKYMQYAKVQVLCTDGYFDEHRISGQIIDTGVADISGWSTVVKTKSGYFTIPNKAIREIFV